MKKFSLCIAFFLLIVLCGSAVLSASAATEMDITSHESWEVVSWEDSFKLRWDKVTGASGYWIAIKNNSSGEYYVQNEYTTKTYFTATNYLPEESCTLKIWVGAVTDSSVEPVNSFTSEIIYVYLGHEPDVTIGGSSSITESSAVLEMSVDRDYGFAIEDCGFYVGTSSTKSKMEQYSFWDYSTSYDADTKGTKYMTIPDLEPGTKYYYRAYAVNAAGEYYTSSYKTFTTTKGSLDRPVITYPADDSTCYTGSDIKLQWNSVSGADSYTYYIKQLSGTPDPTDDDEPYVNMWSASTTKKYYTLDKENLVPGYWYKFVVKASADDAGDGWSEWHYVYIEKGTLEKAEVVSPDNTATYPGGQSIKFEWEAVESAEKYTYYIKQLSGIPDRTNDNEPSIGDPWTETITGTSVTLSGSDVVPGYWYKFVVEATADNMNASWSEWIYCYVDQIQLEKPEILKPTEWTELHESESIVVDWDNVEGADGYVCHIKQLVGEPDSSNNNEPAVFSVKEECSSSRYTLSGDNVHGGYWYKFVIEACSDSAPSTWSNWVYVYVPENGTLERTTISSPSASREYEWGEDILFTWTKVDNATNYTYYVKQLKGEPDSSSNEEAYNLWTGTTNASNRFFTLPGDQVLPDMWYKFVVKAEADGYDTSWSKYTYVYIPDREDWTHAVLKGVVNTVEDEGFANNELLRTFDASESQLATIGKRAFDSCVNLRSIFLPNSVVSIADDAFVNCPQLTIHCYKGSYVQEYAQKKNIPYVLHGVVEKTDMLQLSRTEWNISTAELAEAVITVNSSSKWTASSSASWLTLSETSGTDGANIVFKAAENTSKTSRTAKVTFTCGDASAVVSVSQSGSSGKECTLDLHPDYWEPTSSQRTREIVVTHEDGFTVSSNKSWLDYSVSNATITAEVSSSALNTSQTGILTITCKDCGAVKTVTVAIQQQVVPTPTTVTTSSDEPHAIKVSWKTVSGASYIIERSSDGGSTWKEIATVDAGVTSYTDGDGNVIGASSTHWYRVTATKVLSGSAVRSEPSEAVAGTSIAEVVLSFTGTVGNIGDNGRAALSSLSTLSWTGMTDVTYKVSVKDVETDKYVGNQKNLSTDTATSHTMTGLTEGRQYRVWVGAYNRDGRLMGQTKARTFFVTKENAGNESVGYSSTKINFSDEIWNVLTTSWQLTPYQAAGMMASLKEESQFCPYNAQDFPKWKNVDDRETYTFMVDDVTGGQYIQQVGFGLAQWTELSRKQGLLNYAIQKGNADLVWDFDTQMEYLKTERNIVANMKKTTTLYEATEWMDIKFEVPSQKYESAWPGTRYDTAKEIYKKYTGTDYAEPALNFTVTHSGSDTLSNGYTMNNNAAAGAYGTLVVNSNYYWRVSQTTSNGDWLELGREYGYNGTTQLKVTVKAVPPAGQTYSSTLNFEIYYNGRTNKTVTVKLTHTGSSQTGFTAAQAQKLEAFKKDYPNGWYWTCSKEDYKISEATTTPCSCEYMHGGSRQGKGAHNSYYCDKALNQGRGCGSYWENGVNIAMQCHGYTNLISNEVFGTKCNDWEKDESADCLDRVRPGDVIRYYDSGHSAFVVSVNGSTFTVTDCNWSTNCMIRWDAEVTVEKIKGWGDYFVYKHP